MSKEWKYCCEISQIELKHTDTESHNPLGAGETYHALLRRVFLKTRKDHPTLSPDICLSITVKAINSTVGPDGLCPQLLVFGIPPKIPDVSSKEFPAQKERLRSMQMAREEYDRLVSRALVNLGIRSLPPPSSDHKYMPGNFFYVYREVVKHYTGPHLVACVNKKQVRLHVGECTGPREFNISQLRPAPVARLHSMDELLTQDSAGSLRVLYTEIISPQDRRSSTSAFSNAKSKELIGLIEKGTFRIVLEEEAGLKPNIIPSRFVLALKHSENGEIKHKARFFLGGNFDKDKYSVVNNTVNLKQSSLRLMMVLATILGFNIWPLDVKQPFLQSASKLKRNIFIRPKELDLLPGELLQVMEPLYGLTDSGDYWCETFAKFHLHDLRMEQATGDFALFFRKTVHKLVALSGCYVEDVIQASTPQFKQKIRRQINERFDATFTDVEKFVYTGILCDTSDSYLQKMSQSHYIKRLQYLSNDADFSEYCSLRAKLMWTVHTRPDIAFFASLASQTTLSTFTPESVKLVNRVF